MNRKILFQFSLVGSLALLTLVSAQAVFGHYAPTVTFTVNSTLDEPDANPNDGACSSTPSNLCTLRAAIMEANAMTSGTPKIKIAAGRYRIANTEPFDDTGMYGDLDVLHAVNLIGSGKDKTIIDGDKHNRVFDIFARVKIQGVTIKNGYAVDQGGGIRVHVDGNLKILNSKVTKNFGSDGSGIYSDAPLTMKNSTVLLNLCNSGLGGGAFFGYGASIYNSTFNKNCADQGGGFYVTDKADVGLTWYMEASTVDSNRARLGGGIYSATDGSAFNSTIVSNAANIGSGGAGEGGGINHDSPHLSLLNVTLAQNVAGVGGTGGGLYSSGGANITIKNTILDLNKANGVNDECQGSVTQNGYNIVYAPLNCNLSVDNTSDTGIHAGLEPLAYNGGPTRTRALTANSAATDFTKSCTFGNGNPITIDQRGEPRPADGDGDGKTRCDIGAFELQP